MPNFEGDGFRKGNVDGTEFLYFLQGGLDCCCGFYSVINAFSYLFARDFLANEHRVNSELLRRDKGFYWKKIKSHRLVREHIATAYWQGAYPRDVEELAQFVNDEIFGGKYVIERFDDHGGFKDKNRALEPFSSQEVHLVKAVHLVLVEESKEDEEGHWIVLVRNQAEAYGCIIDSNRCYVDWVLNDNPFQLVVHREAEEGDIEIHKVQSTISISRPA